jgi:hypothetical protein
MTDRHAVRNSADRRASDVTPSSTTSAVPDSHLALVDIRRADGRELLVQVMGLVELVRVWDRGEPYVAAMHSHGGSMRSIRSVRTPEELVDFVRQATVIAGFAARVSYGLEPALLSRVVAQIGAGSLPAGRA